MALVLTGTLTIDCNNISCLTWQDTTGAYSLSNPNGYGAPNPEIAEIVSIAFNVVDSNGDTYSYSDAPYSPNSAGTSTICITAANLTDGSDPIVFVPGADYTFYYSVNFADGGEEISKEFTFPCCGAGITSNLTTNFAVEESLGATSITFADITGIYNASTNAGGYGTPNPAYADITSTLIVVTLENGNVYTFDSFIPTAADHQIEITAAELGYTTVIEDQIINIEYSVYVAGDCRVGYKNSGILLSARTETCIDARTAVLLNDDCACSDAGANNTDNLLEMRMMLDVIKLTATKNISCVAGKIQSLYQRCTAGCSDC